MRQSLNTNGLNAITFKRCAIQWLDEVKPELKCSSQAKYRNVVNLYLLPALGKEKLIDVSRNKISVFSSTLLTSGGVRKKGLSPSTVNSILTVLKRILDYASLTTGIPTVSFHKLRINDRKTMVTILRRSEQKRLCDYLCENLSSVNLGILLSMSYGLRIGEICALRWRDINLEEGALYIGRTLMRKQTFSRNGKKTEVVVSSQKSAFSERKIPLFPQMLELLTARQHEDDAYVLTEKASRVMEPRALTNHFKKALRACKIRDVKFHTLRHTFATYWIEKGYDIKSLSEILGHSSVNVTLNFYVHPSMESKRRIISDYSKEMFAIKRK